VSIKFKFIVIYSMCICLCLHCVAKCDNMTGVKVIILLSGKRKSGKDYVASMLYTK